MPFTASLRALAARNLGNFMAGIFIFAPVRGFAPFLAFIAKTLNVPSRAILISPCFFRDSWMILVRDFTTAAATFFVTLAFSATLETSSVVFMAIPPDIILDRGKTLVWTLDYPES